MSFTGKKLRQFVPPSALVYSPGSAPTLGTANTGGQLTGNQTYYVKYTWVTKLGETQCSPEASIVVPAGTNTNTITVTIPSLIAGAIKANVYISTSTGVETLQGNTVTTSYVQANTLVAGVAQPGSNSANLAYMVPANTATILKSLLANNVDTSQAHGLYMYIIPANDPGNYIQDYQFLSDWQVQPSKNNGAQGFNDHIVLNAGDALVFYQDSVNNINVILSGTEVV